MVDLTRKKASATSGGELTDGNQTLAGNKTFSGNLTVDGDLTVDGKAAEAHSIAMYTVSGHALTNGTGEIGGNEIKWDGNSFENGDAWTLNTSTGVFTVNRDCVLSFTWQIATSASLGNTTTGFHVDRGSGYTREYLNTRDQISAGGFFILLQHFMVSVSAGDKIVMTQNYSTGSPSVTWGYCSVELKPSLVIR